MAAVGETSGAREEEVFIDIPVVAEQLVGYAPTAPGVPLEESEPEEDYQRELPEPVVGRVMRSGSQDPDAEEEDPEAEGEEPPADIDGMGSTADDIIEGLTDRNEELEARIAHLEEQNQTHQFMEDQYRDLAYQLQHDLGVAKTQLQGYESSAQQVGPLLHQLVARNAELRERLDQRDLQIAHLRAKQEAMRFEAGLEVAARMRVREAWAREARRADQLEDQLEARAVRIETLGHALDAAYRRPRTEVGESSRSVRRRIGDGAVSSGQQARIRHDV